MGESERYQDYKNIKFKRRFSVLGDGNALMALFAINAMAFVVLFFIQIGFYYAGERDGAFQNHIINWFQLPGDLKTFSERPWTIFSFMFCESSSFLIRLVSNMLWLWAFGYILQDLGGNNKLIPIYIYGGWAGAVFFLIANLLIPGQAGINGYPALMGAGVSVPAVATAATVLMPDYRIFRHIRNGMPLWILYAVYMFIHLAGVSGGPAAVLLAHVGGALAGLVFVLALRKGYDGSIWMNKLYNNLNSLFSPGKEKNTLKKSNFYTTAGREPFQKTPHVTQQRVDDILDKINQHGYSFLTEEEKEILRKAADEDL